MLAELGLDEDGLPRPSPARPRSTSASGSRGLLRTTPTPSRSGLNVSFTDDDPPRGRPQERGPEPPLLGGQTRARSPGASEQRL